MVAAVAVVVAVETVVAVVAETVAVEEAVEAKSSLTKTSLPCESNLKFEAPFSPNRLNTNLAFK